MTRSLLSWLATLLLATVPVAAQAPGAFEPGPEEAQFITNTRRLTFEGRRAGEGYFSADGSRMIFQSEREPGNPFYQIYVMDMETGDTTRVSPGTGRTTCAWIHPDGERVLYASTHLDPEAVAKQKAELAKRAEGKEERYSWSYDEHYDIFVQKVDGSGRVNVTNALGYDAEGSFSPDGKLIAFTSNRHAYGPNADELTPEERKRFEMDSAFMLDIYIMNADGTNVKRLMDVKGYDGGPFFSPDGKRICWRRFAPKGETAEIYTMNIDGSDVRKLTSLGHLSWAPFYHPSNEYLVFATNKHGFANFELYLVSVDGGPPVRVTYTDGFDGLAAFTPDGKRMAWTSTRHGGGRKAGQIYIGDWNHEAALAALKKARDKHANAAVTPAELRAHVAHLASPKLAGRATGSAGERAAGDYIASTFADAGLVPDGDNGTYFQPFTFTAGVEPGEANRLAITGVDATLSIGADFNPLGFSKNGAVDAADVVFAGYGINAPATGAFPAYDSFGAIDVAGKWVMVLRGTPGDVDPDWGAHLRRFANERFKAANLADRGACGMIVVHGPRSHYRTALPAIELDGAAGGGSLPAIGISNALADRMLAKGEHGTLASLQTPLEGGEPGTAFALANVAVSTTVDLVPIEKTGRNVLARLCAGDTPIASMIVIGAHYDHLGHGEGGNSLAHGDEVGGIHYGADDNASGVAAVLEIAQWLASMKERGKLPIQHDIVFACWSGEELGLLGSNHYVRSLADGEDVNPPVAAYVNLDMIGRLRDALILQGVGSSDVWRKEIEKRNVPVGLPLKLDDDAFLPTDSTAFYLKGVPVLSAFTGAHGDYHTPRDTPDKLDYDATARIAKLIGLIARGLATSESVPDYRRLERKAGPRRMTGNVALGTMPDYGATDVEGMKIQGTRKGSPADKAGLKSGDVIVELGGKAVTDIYGYMHAMEALKPGTETTIVVERDGKRLTLKILPERKE